MLAYKKAGYSWDSCMCVARIFLSKNIYPHSGWDRRQADAEHWQCQGIGTDYLWFSPTCWEHKDFVFCITEVYLYSWYIIGTSYLWLSNMSHIRNNIDRCMDGQIQIHMQTRAAKIQPQFDNDLLRSLKPLEKDQMTMRRKLKVRPKWKLTCFLCFSLDKEQHRK